MRKNKILSKFNPQNDEEVIVALKPHPLFFSKVFVYTVGFTILILLSFYLLGASVYTSIIIFIAFITIAYTFIWQYTLWVSTFYLITNHRVICQERKNWFRKQMSEANLSDIQMLSHEINGVLNHLLERGDVYIRASGVDGGDVVFKNVANPYEIEKKISEIKKHFSNSDKNNSNQEKSKTIIR